MLGTHIPRWIVFIIITSQKILLCSDGRSPMQNISWEKVVTSNYTHYCNIFFPGLQKDKFASSRTTQNVVPMMTNLTNFSERGSSPLEHLFKHCLFCFPFPILHCMLSLSTAVGMAIAEYSWLTHNIKFSSENLWAFSNDIPQRQSGYFCRKPLSSFYLFLQNMWKAIAGLIISILFSCASS